MNRFDSRTGTATVILGRRIFLLRFLRTAICIAFLPGVLSAQGLLSLDDCLAAAHRNHLTVRIAEAAARVAVLAHEEQQKSILPKVKLIGSASYAPHSTSEGYDPVITNGGELAAQLSVSANVYDGGARGVRTDQFSLDVTRTQAEERRAHRDLRYAISQAYYDALEAQQLVELHHTRLRELSDYSELVERLFNGGGIKYTDLLRARIALETEQSSARRSEQAFASARITLAEAMGSPRDTSFRVRDVASVASPDSTFSLPDIGPPDNLDIAISDLNAKKSLLEVDLARSERLPSISLNGDVGFLTSLENLNLPPGERVRPFGASVGVSIEHPLFSWGVSDLRIQQRELDAQSADLGTKLLKQGLEAELARMKGSLTSAFDQYSTFQRTLTIAQDHFSLIKAQYAGGGVSSLEVLSAEQLLADTREGLLSSRIDMMKLSARIEQLTAR
jgi:outer membrane protein TolC